MSAVLIAPAEAFGQDLVFAMADIHGNYDSAVALLRQAGLVDSDGNWTGGEIGFVQTGDYTDRGPDVRKVLDLLMKLESDAPSGAVSILVGNHEVMNLMGDLRDTTASDYEAFVQEDSDERRRRAWETYVRFERERSERLGLDAQVDGEARERWMAEHPPGFLERREAFGPEGQYGRWLRSRPVVVRKGDSIMLHAGISPSLSSLSIDEINFRIRSEIEAYDLLTDYFVDRGVILPFFTFQEIVAAVRQERDFVAEDTTDALSESASRHLELLNQFLGMGSWLSIHPEGILWFRGYAQWTDEEGPALIRELLDAYDVDRFVVGHTPQAGGVRLRFDGAVVLLDTGMLSTVYTGGRASMVEISSGTVRPVYLN